MIRGIKYRRTNLRMGVISNIKNLHSDRHYRQPLWRARTLLLLACLDYHIHFPRQQPNVQQDVCTGEIMCSWA
jgi:hypothetical protein